MIKKEGRNEAINFKTSLFNLMTILFNELID